MDGEIIELFGDFTKGLFQLRVETYSEYGNLNVKLLSKKDNSEEFEPYGNLTVNAPKKLKPNEAYFNIYEENKGIIGAFLDKNLCEYLPDKGYLGTDSYPIVAFNMDALMRYDSIGVTKHLQKNSQIQIKAPVRDCQGRRQSMETDKNTLTFSGPYGTEELAPRVGSYSENNNLAIGLLSDGEDGIEPFTNLTVNLGIKLPANEAFVKTFDENEGLLGFISEHKLGEVLPEKGRSGFCEYHKVSFDMKKLAELDPGGVKDHLARHDTPVKQRNDCSR